MKLRRMFSIHQIIHTVYADVFPIVELKEALKLQQTINILCIMQSCLQYRMLKHCSVDSVV